MKVSDFKRHDFENEITADVDAIFDTLESKVSDVSIVAEQIKLEIEGFKRGEDNFYRKLQRDFSNDRAGTTPVMARSLRSWYQDCLKEFQVQSEFVAKQRGAKPIWYAVTRDISPEIILRPVLPVIIGVAVESKYTSATSLAVSLGKVVEDTIRFLPLNTQIELEWKKRYEKAHSMRSSSHNKREFVKRVEADHVRSGKLDQWKDWSTEQRAQVGFFMINLVKTATKGAFETETKHNGEDSHNKSYNYSTKLSLNEQWIEAIVEEGLHLSTIRPSYMPMVIPPKPWTAFNDGGYWSQGGKRRPFISSAMHRNIVKQQRKHNMPDVYEAVNIIQDTSLKVNGYILQVLKDVSALDNVGQVLIDNKKKWALKELPFHRIRREFHEMIQAQHSKPTPEQIAEYKRKAREAKETERPIISRRRAIDGVIEMAEKFQKYAAIYLPHHGDFRGRIYPSVNVELHQQRDDVSKSLLVCAATKPMGERGWYWLRVTCASLGEKDGTKNAHPDVRAQWVMDNIATLRDVVSNPLDNIHYWADADAPFQFLACCKECVDAIESGDPESFESGFPVNFDGSCSGIQHYAAMTRDEVSGRQVNLVPMDTKQDLYGVVAERVSYRLTYDRDSHAGADVDKEYEDGQPMPKKWQMAGYLLDFGVGRSFIKQNVMTYSYSATVEGMKSQLLKQVKDHYGDSSRDAVDPLDLHRFLCCRYLAEITHAETGRTVLKPTECMQWLQAVSSALARSGKGLFFTTPDGFPVYQEYLKQDSKQMFVTNLVYNEGVLTKERTQPAIKVDTDKIDSSSQSQSVAPNFIHSMDATHLRMTVRNCYAKGVRSFVMIHDSFGTIPADAQIMFDTVRETMVDIYSRPEWDMLNQVDQYAQENLSAAEYAKLPSKPAKGNLDLEGIKHSTFAFL